MPSNTERRRKVRTRRSKSPSKRTPQALRRLNPKMTLSKLQEATGLSRSMLSRLFSGERTPSVRSVRKLASAMQMDVGELLAALEGIGSR